jgi:hypothetical protein
MANDADLHIPEIDLTVTHSRAGLTEEILKHENLRGIQKQRSEFQGKSVGAWGRHGRL